MFLIFSLGRLDVLPVDDLGVRTAIKDLYRLEGLPDKSACLASARHGVRLPRLARGTDGGAWT